MVVGFKGERKAKASYYPLYAAELCCLNDCGVRTRAISCSRCGSIITGKYLTFQFPKSHSRKRKAWHNFWAVAALVFGPLLGLCILTYVQDSNNPDATPRPSKPSWPTPPPLNAPAPRISDRPGSAEKAEAGGPLKVKEDPKKRFGHVTVFNWVWPLVKDRPDIEAENVFSIIGLLSYVLGFISLGMFAAGLRKTTGIGTSRPANAYQKTFDFTDVEADAKRHAKAEAVADAVRTAKAVALATKPWIKDT